MSRHTCMLVCVFFLRICTRDRGCQPAPGFPCALCLSEGERETQSSGAIAPRGRIRFLAVIARSTCDEAIQLSLRLAEAGLLRFARNDVSLFDNLICSQEAGS